MVIEAAFPIGGLVGSFASARQAGKQAMVGR
jgi:hypothetical protein